MPTKLSKYSRNISSAISKKTIEILVSAAEKDSDTYILIILIKEYNDILSVYNEGKEYVDETIEYWEKEWYKILYLEYDE